jgi:uncharacterized protein YcaQ
VREIRSANDLLRLRRAALAAQGLLQSAPFGHGRAGARRALAHLGYVQIDSISVVERAHHHVLHSRVPGFTPTMTEQLLQNREIFEYWSHAAAFLPIEDFRFSLPYKQAIKKGQIHWFKKRDRKLMQHILDRIRADGPLRARDLESGVGRREGWWDWKPTKQALEQLYMQGDLMVSKREGFQKTYDLTERVLPDNVDTTAPDLEDFAAHLVDQQLRCHGVVSVKAITYLRRVPGLRDAVKALVDARIQQGALESLRFPGGEAYLAKAGVLDERLPRSPNRVLILSPFDNSVIQRERLKTLFDFDYQIECYLPEAKRRYGYFSLPLLYRDTFVGRMDCKAHRKERHLEIKTLHLEHSNHDLEPLLEAFAQSVRRFCDFQDCDSVAFTEVVPNHLGPRLARVLARQ